MVSLKLDTGFNIEVYFRISPFHKRLFAWIIDTLLISLADWLVFRAVTTVSPRLADQSWVAVLFSLPTLFYYPTMEILMNGQTIGKRALRIRVITLAGGQATVGQYLLRWVFRTADFPIWIFVPIYFGAFPWWSSILFFSGLACVLASPYTQRIGDVIAGTIVIEARSKTSWQDTLFTEVSETYKPMYPDVMRMSDRDMNSLKGIIDTVKKSHDHDLATRIAERIKQNLGIQSDQEPLDFLERLLSDYNYMS